MLSDQFSELQRFVRDTRYIVMGSKPPNSFWKRCNRPAPHQAGPTRIHAGVPKLAAQCYSRENEDTSYRQNTRGRCERRGLVASKSRTCTLHGLPGCREHSVWRSIHPFTFHSPSFTLQFAQSSGVFCPTQNPT